MKLLFIVAKIKEQEIKPCIYIVPRIYSIVNLGFIFKLIVETKGHKADSLSLQHLCAGPDTDYIYNQTQPSSSL